jgi:hypothetical protein
MLSSTATSLRCCKLRLTPHDWLSPLNFDPVSRGWEVLEDGQAVVPHKPLSEND